MFKKENIKETLVIIGSLILLVGIWTYSSSKDKSLAGVGNMFQIGGVLTTTTINPSKLGPLNNNNVASSTLILVANESRRYARCTNLSGPAGGADSVGIPISVVFGKNTTLGYGATTTGNFGVILSPMASTTQPSFFEINESNPFAGPVYASALATTTITCTEN